MRPLNMLKVCGVSAMCAVVHGGESSAQAAVTLPPGFITIQIAPPPLLRPVDIEFAEDGRMFVAQQNGVVRVFANDAMQSAAFIDLRAEVAGAGFRGLLGIALDPDFLKNRRVYLAYAVDPIAGEPDETAQVPTFCRVTRYTGTASSNGNVADPASRTILLGDQPGNGIPLCWQHSIDTLRFGQDGSLLVSAGDGAHSEYADDGGDDGACFQPPLFGSDQDLGSFRAQYHGSLAGKILRINPENGQGYPDNPFWNGDPMSIQSRIYVTGCRNPFRFCVRPQNGSNPVGTLYIGDVGWDSYEEINVSKDGGENFGWPCYEGPAAAAPFPTMNPPSSGCNTIGTPANPGALTAPLAYWHHGNPNLSVPAGYVGVNAIGGEFYNEGDETFPMAYHGGYFYGEWGQGWINVLRVDGDDQILNSWNFLSGFTINQLTDIAFHPLTGDMYLASVFSNMITRIRYIGPDTGDINGDGIVDVDDLLAVINNWGPCSGGPVACPPDITGNGEVDVDDLLMIINNWG